MAISPDNSVIVTTDAGGIWNIVKKDDLNDCYLIVQKSTDKIQVHSDVNFVPW